MVKFTTMTGTAVSMFLLCMLLGSSLAAALTMKIVSRQPNVGSVPSHEENSALPAKFTKIIEVTDMVRMHSVCFNLSWNMGGDGTGAWNTNDPYYGWKWSQVRVENVKLLITEPIKQEWKKGVAYDWGPSTPLFGGAIINDTWVYVCFELKDPPYAALLNGTFPLISITFEKQDPWYCGRQPQYYFDQPHLVFTEPCVTDFWFDGVCYFDFVDNPNSAGYAKIWFGTAFGDTRNMYNYAVYFEYLQGDHQDFTTNKYTFTAIPGDLNLDGVVDIKDVMIEANYYGLPVAVYPNMYYDLNRDGFIDVYDIVLVTKNFGRTSP
jgi:hypothetical protein